MFLDLYGSTAGAPEPVVLVPGLDILMVVVWRVLRLLYDLVVWKVVVVEVRKRLVVE